ncbi:MAG: hypothetical protein HXY47_00245 [Nitrospirae bacterium]|nr:hypothetical protein [Nitrospirota bacterium]
MIETHLRKELKEKFIIDFSPSEKLYFLTKAKEAILIKGYRAGEDLFHYCYFLTLRDRFRKVSTFKDEGFLRFLLVEGTKDLDEAIKLYEEKLEKNKLNETKIEGYRFLEYFLE